MVGIVIVSHSHRIAEGVAELRPRDGRTGRAARDRRGSGPARASDRHRRRAGDGGDRPGVVRRRGAGPHGPGKRGALGGDGARPHAGGASLRRPALRGADRGGSRCRSRHGEAGRAAGARRSGSPRRTRREGRAPRGHRYRVVAGAVAASGRRVIDHAEREQPARAARAAGRQVRADRVVVRRPCQGARRDERPRTGRRLQLERGRDARCDAGSHDRGRRVGPSGIRGAGGDRGARRARLRRSSRTLRTGARRSVSVFPEGSGVVRGYPASAGIAIGPARRFRTPDLAIPDGAGTAEVELAALDAALGTVGDDIARQRALVAGRADGDAAKASTPNRSGMALVHTLFSVAAESFGRDDLSCSAARTPASTSTFSMLLSSATARRATAPSIRHPIYALFWGRYRDCN